MVGDEIGPIASDCLRRSYAGKSGDVGIFDNLQVYKVYMRWVCSAALKTIQSALLPLCSCTCGRGESRTQNPDTKTLSASKLIEDTAQHDLVNLVC